MVFRGTQSTRQRKCVKFTIFTKRAFAWRMGRDTCDEKEEKDSLLRIWKRLKNDSDFNVEIAAMIIRMNADGIAGTKDISLYTPTEMRSLFASYNGTGTSAKNYGEECYNWYSSFQWYHSGEEK